MATARATLEVRAVARDQMSGPLLASVDRLRDRVNRFGQAMSNGMNIVKAFFAIKAAGKVVDFLEKYSTGDVHKEFVESQKAMEFTFKELGHTMADELAPSFTKIFDGLRMWAEEWGPTIVGVMKKAAEFGGDLLSKMSQGFGKLRNWIYEIAEQTQFIPLQGKKAEIIKGLTEDYFREELERARKQGEDPSRAKDPGLATQYLWERAQSRAYFRFAEGYTGSGEPSPRPDVPVEQKFDLSKQLTERWTIGLDYLNKSLFSVITTIEGGLVNALDAATMSSKKGSEQFKAFGEAILNMIRRMLIEAGVRGTLGTIFNLGGFGDSSGAQGFGGGGGNTTNVFHIQAIDTQSFAVAAVRADRSTRYLGNLMQANLIRRPDVRQRAGRRR